MFEFFLKYPRIVFDQGELILTRTWSPWIALVLLVISTLLITIFIVLRHSSLDLKRLGVIWLCQFCMLIVVLLVIWQPAILTERLRAEDNVIAYMLDASESMNYSEDTRSRMQEALSLFDEGVFETFENKYDIQRYLFTDTASAVDSYEVLPPPESVTTIGESLLEVLSMSRSTPLGAIILITDGADNAGTLTQEQLAEISAFNVPVHTIGIGRDKIEEDIELQDVTLPGQALPGTILSARVAIRHDKPGIARLKIYDDDRLLMANEIELMAGTGITTSLIDIPVSDTGYRHLRFTLDPWPDEQVIENNNQSAVVEVKEEKYRVLYIEGEPRWEYKFIRRAMEDDPSVELVSLLRVSQNKFYRQGIDSPDELEGGLPAEKTDLFKYHALIIGSIEAASFTPEQQQMIHDFVSERGGSLMMLAGPNGLGAGGWENTPVHEALPARLTEQGSEFIRDKIKVELTTAGLHAPMLKLHEDLNENRRLWQELPEIANFQSIGTLKPAASIYLDFSTQTGLERKPLLVSQPYGRGFSYIFASAGSWRWQMSLPAADLRHETFWRQLLRELVINSPGRFRMTSQVIADHIKLTMEVRNEIYEPERELNLTAVVTPESGELMTVEFQNAQEFPGVMIGEFSADESGLYSIESITRRGDEPIESSRMAIYHNAGMAEYFSMRTNLSLLNQLADATGGRNWSPGFLDELQNAVEFSQAGITEREIRPLWDAPLLFLLLLGLKSIEWLLRRNWKTI
jgi:uncharacterized membrane protein